MISNEKVTWEVSLTNVSSEGGTFSKKHFNKVFFMGTVLSLDWEKNMQSRLFPSRDVYGVKIMLSPFSGNLNYFPFVDYKVSRRSAPMPIKASGGVCINSPESGISLLLSCTASALLFLSYVKVRFAYWYMEPPEFQEVAADFPQAFRGEGRYANKT